LDDIEVKVRNSYGKVFFTMMPGSV